MKSELTLILTVDILKFGRIREKRKDRIETTASLGRG